MVDLCFQQVVLTLKILKFSCLIILQSQLHKPTNNRQEEFTSLHVIRMDLMQKRKGKKMNLCIKTKNFITIRLKKPNENTTTLQVQMFFIDIYIFFLSTSIKKKTLYEKTQNAKEHVLQCICLNKK